MKLLLVQDQNADRSVELGLSAAGHAVHVTDTCKDACNLSILYDYDAIIMALDFDDLRGAQAIRTLRARKVTTPLIGLGDHEVEPRVEALVAGADHVMVRPFHEAELLVRLAAVVRRSRGYAKSILHNGPIALDLATGQVEVAGRPVRLTPDEYAILELLSLRRNTPLSREQCLSHLPCAEGEPAPTRVDAVFAALCRKISAANGGDPWIETIWGDYRRLPDAPEQRIAA